MEPIRFNSWETHYKHPFGAVAAGAAVSLSLELSVCSGLSSPALILYRADEWESPCARIPLLLENAAADYRRYTASYTPEHPALLFYRFEAAGPGGPVPIGRDNGPEAVLSGQGLWQLTVYDPALQTPSCLKGGVLYQIFPDRFFNSGAPKQQVPKDRILHGDWYELPEFRPDEQGRVLNNDYFGGDLKGIQEKLPYLKSLGVTALYLNPIFEAHSNHRYNTADYEKVDPLLGCNQDFTDLCRAAGALGISILLDGVFSHTGSDSVYFNRDGRYGDSGAYRDPGSPYRSWYRFTHYPDRYESWWGFETLPNVDEQNPGYLDFICGQDGVLRQWLDRGAAGFRLDVADELPDGMLDRIHETVKGHHPDSAVIGEVWEDASNKVSYGQRRRYLLGGQLDSVMNYPWMEGILRYLRTGGGRQFFATLMTLMEHYPRPVLNGLMTSLSTHDTSRAITVLAGEDPGNNGRDWQAAHHRLSAEQYARGRVLLMLGSLIQFTLPGSPCVYYGDEAGLSGYRDPFNRACYPWGREDTGLIGLFRLLGALRLGHPVFQEGEWRPLRFTDSLCAYLREDSAESLLIAVNRSEHPEPLELPMGFAPGLPPLLTIGSYSDGALQGLSGVVLGRVNAAADGRSVNSASILKGEAKG